MVLIASAIIVKRWPVIITSIIDNVYQENNEIMTTGSSDDANDKIFEGKQLIQHLSELKFEMSRDRPLRFIPDDRGVDIASYNNELQSLMHHSLNTWFSAPWLFAECVITSLILPPPI